MFLGQLPAGQGRDTSPHTRGDVPDGGLRRPPILLFSPHTWGCSEVQVPAEVKATLLPTHVGMFRRFGPPRRSMRTSPHTRGDVPEAIREAEGPDFFSPHTWGCSARSCRTARFSALLPTHVGMFRAGRSTWPSSRPSPHTRGDVPMPTEAHWWIDRFSPHTWGCSDRRLVPVDLFDLLPTHVGMFRARYPRTASAMASPHTRGDVP